MKEDKTKLIGYTEKPGQTFIRCHWHEDCLFNDEESRCRTHFITVPGDGGLGCYFPTSKLLGSISIGLNLFALDDPERQERMSKMREMIRLSVQTANEEGDN